MNVCCDRRGSSQRIRQGKGAGGDRGSPKPERGRGGGGRISPRHGNTCVSLMAAAAQPRAESRNEYSAMNASGNAAGRNEVQIKQLWESS